jgi:hypothetical protein
MPGRNGSQTGNQPGIFNDQRMSFQISQSATGPHGQTAIRQF